MAPFMHSKNIRKSDLPGSINQKKREREREEETKEKDMFPYKMELSIQ